MPRLIKDKMNSQSDLKRSEAESSTEVTATDSAAVSTLTRRAALRQLAIGTSAICSLFALPRLSYAAENQKIISIGGALTEIVYALNAQQQLIGIDTTSNYPEATQKLANVGYARSLSLEGVLALGPQLILASEDAGPPAVIQQLKSSGIALEIIAANHRYEGLLERVKRVGDLLGKPKEAQQLRLNIDRDWQQTQQHIQAQITARNNLKKAAPKLMFILAHTPNQIMVSGKDTSAHAMMEYAGANNVFSSFSGYKPLTPEALIAAQPECIVVTDQGVKASGGIDAILQRPGFAQTPAGKQRHVVSMEAMLLLGFGPRLPSALQTLHQALLKTRA